MTMKNTRLEIVRHELFAEPGNGPDRRIRGVRMGRKTANVATPMHPAIHIAYRIREKCSGPWVQSLRFVLYVLSSHLSRRDTCIQGHSSVTLCNDIVDLQPVRSRRVILLV